MKRNKLLMCLFIALSSLVTSIIHAEYYPVKIIFSKKKNNSDSLKRNAPMNLPIEVRFDSSTGVLDISAPEDMDGMVYVYTEDGRLEATSGNLNCTITLSSKGLHILSIH
ncbi:MAG: hypothetical protein K2J15_06935 [Muribaculaceae bacterium]|nr:hypothetical protein [Muribaculaceae bacterium]